MQDAPQRQNHAGEAGASSAPDAPQLGPEVTLEEVAACAKSGCKVCQGAGYTSTWARVHREKGARRAKGIERFRNEKKEDVPKKEACHCARHRFLVKHAGRVALDEGGRIFWLAAEVPAP